MTDLAQALRDFVLLFERMGTPYAVMGGIAAGDPHSGRPLPGFTLPAGIKTS
jgi:hypothetical protein